MASAFKHGLVIQSTAHGTGHRQRLSVSIKSRDNSRTTCTISIVTFHMLETQIVLNICDQHYLQKKTFKKIFSKSLEYYQSVLAVFCIQVKCSTINSIAIWAIQKSLSKSSPVLCKLCCKQISSSSETVQCNAIW